MVTVTRSPTRADEGARTSSRNGTLRRVGTAAPLLAVRSEAEGADCGARTFAASADVEAAGGVRPPVPGAVAAMGVLTAFADPGETSCCGSARCHSQAGTAIAAVNTSSVRARTTYGWVDSMCTARRIAHALQARLRAESIGNATKTQIASVFVGLRRKRQGRPCSAAVTYSAARSDFHEPNVSSWRLCCRFGNV